MAKKSGFFFFFLFTKIVFSQDLPQLRLVGQPEKSATEFVGANIVDVNGRTCAAIQVLSDLNGFSYDAYNQVVKVDDQPGRDMVFLQPEEQVLEILLSGYQPLKLILREIGILLASREVWVIKITGDKKLTELPIVIVSNPDAAEIFIDGQSRGTGNQHKVAVGQHEIRLLKTKYQPAISTIIVDENHTFFKFDLREQQDVNFQIDSDPRGATAYLDDVKLPGTTLISAFYPAGRYKLRIEKEWYLPLEDYIDIQEGVKNKPFKLKPDFATLTVSSAPESGLDILLNGRLQAVRTPDTFAQLPPGTYRIRARSRSYETDEVEVQLARGDAKSVKLTSSVNYATLTIRTRPGATVLLNGQKIEQLQNIQLEPSIVTLRAEMPKARPAEQRLVLKKGEFQTIDLMPDLPTGAIQVAVVPLEAKVELEGDGGEYFSSTGAASFTEIPVGTYMLKVLLNGYDTKQEKIVLLQDDKITKSIVLDKSPVQSTLTSTTISDSNFIALGNTLMRAKEWGKAAAMYERKFKSDPSYVVAYVNFALCKMALKEWEPALVALRKTVELRPTYIYGHIYLARALASMDSLQSARQSYLTMVPMAETEPDKYKNELGEAYRYATFVYLTEKTYTKALDSVTHALEYRPEDVELHLWRAQILHALNRRDEARKQYDKVLKLDAKNADAKKGIDLLNLYN